MNVFNYHLTDSCNYNCTYCFGRFPDKKEPTLEEAYLVVDNIYRYFFKNGVADGRINLAGGEPLLYPYLDDLIDYINAYGIKVSIITNGSLLTEERIAHWKDKVYCIGLSFDSALPDTNLTIGRCCKNKPITVKQAVRLTQAIHRNGIKLKINTVVSKLNANENMTVFYKRLKPDRLKLLQVEIVEDINDTAEKLAITRKAFDEFCKRHKNCCRDTVCESSETIENSYLMINPQGEFQLNDCGKYKIYGNCLNEELSAILTRVPIKENRFDLRYGKSSEKEVGAKKICVFGGHPTWLKFVKEKFTGARFITGDLHSVDVIRTADEIWIQSNAISHSFYGKVVDTARVYKIPICYFRYAGTKKCIEQVILQESS